MGPTLDGLREDVNANQAIQEYGSRSSSDYGVVRS